MLLETPVIKKPHKKIFEREIKEIKLKEEQEQRYRKKWELIQKVQEMYKIIPNKAHICRYFSLSRGTVEKYLAIKEPTKPQPRIRASILDDYKGRIIELMNEGKKSKDIFKEIKSEGFQGSYRRVQNFIKKYRRKKTEELFIQRSRI